MLVVKAVNLHHQVWIRGIQAEFAGILEEARAGIVEMVGVLSGLLVKVYRGHLVWLRLCVHSSVHHACWSLLEVV